MKMALYRKVVETLFFAIVVIVAVFIIAFVALIVMVIALFVAVVLNGVLHSPVG